MIRPITGGKKLIKCIYTSLWTLAPVSGAGAVNTAQRVWQSGYTKVPSMRCGRGSTAKLAGEIVPLQSHNVDMATF